MDGAFLRPLDRLTNGRSLDSRIFYLLFYFEVVYGIEIDCALSLSIPRGRLTARLMELRQLD